MSMAMPKPWSMAQFLAWEETQTLRHEFADGQAVAMTGGTLEHDAIQVNIVTALAQRLRGTPCRVHGNSLKVRVMGSIRYPDAFVTCTAIPQGSTVVDEPVVIFEVLSRHTARTDRMVKNREYAATPSVRRYIMLEQAAMEGMMFTRTEAGDWIGHIMGPETILHMAEIGASVELAEFYEGVAFAAPDEGEARDVV